MSEINFKTLNRRMAELLLKKKQTLGVAESCTGGLLSATITARPGASRYFDGAVVSYSNSVKTKTLGVPTRLLIKHGAVSKAVALAMARGARKRLKCHWSIAVTGVAGPGGGTEQKPVGLVHFGFAGPGLLRADRRIFKGSRRQIQKKSVEFALKALIKELEK
jgi:PncC family amidohydrolase